MTAITSTQSGNWSATSTWAGGVVPGNGDTATVNHDVSVDADVTIGTSDVAGTLVLDVDGGDLTVAEDVTLTLRGDMEVDVGDTLTLQAGATLKFDSSLSASPSTTAYRLHLSKVNYQSGYLVCQGVIANRCTVTSETANSAAYGQIRSSALTGSMQADFTDFQYLGSSSVPAIYLNADDSDSKDLHFKDCTFDNCGQVQLFRVESTRTFTLQRVVFTNPLATQDFAFASTNIAGSTTVLDEVVFANKPGTFLTRAGISITNCYFPKSFVSNGTTQWAKFEGNVCIDTGAVPMTFYGAADAGGIKDNLFLVNVGSGTVRWAYANSSGGNVLFNGCVFDCTGPVNSISDVISPSTGGAGNTITVKNCLTVPTSSFTSPGALITGFGDSNITIDCYHNTASIQGTKGAITVGQTYTGHSGMVANAKSNLFWTPAGETAGFKGYRFSGNVQDIITPANWDYNWSYNLAAGTETNGFEDAGGPGDMFSTVPTDGNGGSGDPAFFDPLRNVATYDAANDGLANYAPSWATSTDYVVGDIVANADSSYYYGETINYRCIADHTSGAATEPGVGASWRTNWELATLYRMRENLNVIASCVAWIKAGFAPTNQTLENAGHDSVTIGAVEYTAGTPTPTPSPGYAEALTTWESNMLSYGATHAAGWNNDTYDFSYGFYDAQRVFYNIADYTEDTDWLTAAEKSGDAYRDVYVIPNNGIVPGYWNFTRGLYEDWDRNTDATSKAALVALSENAAYATDSTPLANTVNADLSREVAYAINAYIDAERAGETHRTRMEDLVDQIIGTGGHFEQWFIDESDPDFAPFMFALSCEALINYYTYISEDADIITAIQTGADYIWTNAWVADDRSFWYRMTDTSLGSPDLNLVIAPVFGWLYWKTGDTDYRDAGDEIFRGGVDLAWLDGSKQFNQNYRWSADYVAWRALGEANTGEPAWRARLRRLILLT